jgi:hypothetical protein
MKQSFMTETAQTAMSMHDVYLFPYHDVPEDWKERENCRECGRPIYDSKGDMVHFDAVRKVAYALAVIICVRDHYDFVASVYELR